MGPEKPVMPRKTRTKGALSQSRKGKQSLLGGGAREEEEGGNAYSLSRLKELTREFLGGSNDKDCTQHPRKEREGGSDSKKKGKMAVIC